MASQSRTKFPAEIKQVSSKKTASLDIVYRVIFETADPTVMNLGVLAADVLVDVTVDLQK